jgi:2-polyprenyl-6-hydroxyphenyl methylase / 3-demethylubiquinone-9 3-methyltransferase
LFAEEIARLGASVIGIDPAPGAIAVAQQHAAKTGLDIDYRIGPGEHLPADDACADIASCVDVLEHVADVDAVAGEIARVLKPGGLFLFDTINRTRFSKLVAIKLAQDWAMTAFMPPGLHDWNQFITPAELRTALARHHLRQDGLTGLKPGVSPPALIRLMRQLKKGRLSCGELRSHAAFVLTKDLRVSYIGHATKIASPEAAALRSGCRKLMPPGGIHESRRLRGHAAGPGTDRGRRCHRVAGAAARPG